nr:MarR family transcriptional regulator [Saprospiraceae bacterium]
MPPFEEEIKSGNFQSEQHKAMLNIVYTGNWFQYQHAGFLKKFHISLQQYNMLRILRGQGSSMAMNDIKSRMLDKTPNMTRLADKLIQKALVDRTRCQKDRRVVFLKISDGGLRLLNRIDLQWADEFRPEYRLSVEEAFIVNQLMDKLRT